MSQRRNYFNSTQTMYVISEVSSVRFSPKWKRSDSIRETSREHRQTSTDMRYKGNTYEELKSECLYSKLLFEDPDFNPGDSSIQSLDLPRGIVWLRPHEIADKHGKDPEFYIEGKHRFDFKPGPLSDCWVISGLACLGTHKEILDMVVPPKQSFKKDYTGIFCFRFWTCGDWVEVVIDDKLPTLDGELLFLQSASGYEFWGSLLEKAYAKLYGSYELLKSGKMADMLVDLTGGVSEMFRLKGATPPALYHVISAALSDKKTIISGVIFADSRRGEYELPNGLLMGHSYSITDVIMLDMINGTKIPLVRMMSLWGDVVEWNGRWSRRSEEWTGVYSNIRKELNKNHKNNGDFWMCIEDFVYNFDAFYICCLPTGIGQGLGGKAEKWKSITLDGKWKRNVSAGGSTNHSETFWTNPQFQFEITDVDEGNKDGLATVIVALMQIVPRKNKKVHGKNYLTIGYTIYHLKRLVIGPREKQFFANTPVLLKSDLVRVREVSGRHRLRRGNYLIVPSTASPREEGNFLLRMFSKRAITSEEIDEKTEIEPFKETRLGPISFIDLSNKQEEEKSEKRSSEAFMRVAGADLEIDAYELQAILDSIFEKEFKFDGFSVDTCKSLLAMRDTNASGKLGFEEFQMLIKEMRPWMVAFKKYDSDCHGFFRTCDLRGVLKNIGFRVSNQTLSSLATRFGHKDGRTYLDDFMHMLSRLSTTIYIYREMSSESRGSVANFTLDSFIQTTIYT